MIITRMSLPRRTFLRGAGAALALPLLDAMVPAATALARTAARPTKRLGFIYIPNGANMSQWTPGADGPLELSPILSPLAPVKEHVVIPTGLAHRQAEAWGDGNGEHSRASGVWLNGVHPRRTEGADVRAGTTADQIAAAALGQDTPLPSLEISLENSYVVGNCDNGYSCVYTNTIAWRTPTTPLPMEHNPRVVFERLFGEGGTSAQRAARLREDRSILDAVREDMARLEKRLGAGDRRRARQYLDAVREIERRIQRVEAQAGDGDLPENLARPVGIPDSFTEHARLMFDLQALAFQADVTRVFTYLIGREQTAQSYPEVGVPDAHHSVSHHQLDPAQARAVRQDQHVPRGHPVRVPPAAAGDPGRRRVAARPLPHPLRRGHQRRRPALAHRPAADSRRRRGGTAEGGTARALPERHPDDQPATGDAGQGGGRGARDDGRQHGAASSGAADGVGRMQIKLRYSPSSDKRAAPLSRYKPGGADDGPGPSLWVNPAFVEGYFRGVTPEQARLTLVVEPNRHAVDHPAITGDGPAATRIKLRHRPPREKKAAPVAYYKPDNVDDEQGPSLFVNQTFVKGYFRGVEPQRARPVLIVEHSPARLPH